MILTPCAYLSIFLTTLNLPFNVLDYPVLVALVVQSAPDFRIGILTEASIVLYFFIIVYFMSNLAYQYLFMKKVDPYHAYHSRDPEKQIISLFILEFVIFLYTSTVLEKIALEWHY